MNTNNVSAFGSFSSAYRASSGGNAREIKQLEHPDLYPNSLATLRRTAIDLPVDRDKAIQSYKERMNSLGGIVLTQSEEE